MFHIERCNLLWKQCTQSILECVVWLVSRNWNIGCLWVNPCASNRLMLTARNHKLWRRHPKHYSRHLSETPSVAQCKCDCIWAHHACVNNVLCHDNITDDEMHMKELQSLDWELGNWDNVIMFFALQTCGILCQLLWLMPYTMQHIHKSPAGAESSLQMYSITLLIYSLEV